MQIGLSVRQMGVFDRRIKRATRRPRRPSCVARLGLRHGDHRRPQHAIGQQIALLEHLHDRIGRLARCRPSPSPDAGAGRTSGPAPRSPSICDFSNAAASCFSVSSTPARSVSGDAFSAASDDSSESFTARSSLGKALDAVLVRAGDVGDRLLPHVFHVGAGAEPGVAQLRGFGLEPSAATRRYRARDRPRPCRRRCRRRGVVGDRRKRVAVAASASSGFVGFWWAAIETPCMLDSRGRLPGPFDTWGRPQRFQADCVTQAVRRATF